MTKVKTKEAPPSLLLHHKPGSSVSAQSQAGQSSTPDPAGSPPRVSATANEGMRQPHPCYRTLMDDDTSRPPPPEWLRAIEESDADLAAGRIVPASVVHAELDATIAELEAREVTDADNPASQDAPPHQP